MHRIYGIRASENGIDRIIVALAKTHAHQSKEKAGIFQRLPLNVYLISNSLIISTTPYLYRSFLDNATRADNGKANKKNVQSSFNSAAMTSPNKKIRKTPAPINFCLINAFFIVFSPLHKINQFSVFVCDCNAITINIYFDVIPQSPQNTSAYFLWVVFTILSKLLKVLPCYFHCYFSLRFWNVLQFSI